MYESKHYVFHVEEGSLAEKDIQIIKARQESAYEKIISTLKIKEPGQKIIYYFYPSQEKKEELMGDGWYGQSIYNEFTVHAIYNEQDKVVGEHEDTHLLSLQMGLPISLFQEGIAECMVESSMFGNNHNDVLKMGMERGLEPNLTELMSQEGWLNTPDREAEFYYSIAGSFIRYLLDIIDLDTFKKLYSDMSRDNTKEKNIEIFESTTRMSIENAEAKWQTNYILI